MFRWLPSPVLSLPDTGWWELASLARRVPWLDAGDCWLRRSMSEGADEGRVPVGRDMDLGSIEIFLLEWRCARFAEL